MNARQRQGLILIIGAVILGLGAFVLMASYAGSVNSQVGDKVTVYQYRADVPALSELTERDVEAVEIPRRWLGEGVVTDRSFLGRKTFVPVQAGSYVDVATLIPIQDLKAGEREIAINVDAESGVGGRIRPGDYVNILVAMEEPVGTTTLRSSDVLISRARVVSFGGEREKADGEGQIDSVVPVTFALSDTDSLKLLYAETFAKAVRLSKVPVGETEKSVPDPITNADIVKKYGG